MRWTNQFILESNDSLGDAVILLMEQFNSYVNAMCYFKTCYDTVTAQTAVLIFSSDNQLFIVLSGKLAYLLNHG